jgi:integrase
MARRPRAVRLETRTARLKLPVRKKPYDFTSIAPRIRLGYRRCKGAGTWVVKVADGHGGHWTKGFAIADDHEDADGEHVLTWWQAQEKARRLARGQDKDGGRPGTVAEALADYERDLVARGAGPANARRVRTLLAKSPLLAKPVALLTVRELKALRDGLIAKGAKAASVNRDLKGFKAALNLAAAHDPRITNVAAWRIGLAALPDAHTARNVILTDEQVRALIAASYAEDATFGILVEAAAVTGARVSQLARLEVADLQTDRGDPRLMMPSSRKGKGVKRIERKPVPITASLAAKLTRAAGGRAPSEPLLLRSDGAPWQSAKADYRLPFIHAVRSAGLDPTVVTLYSLRHSSIVRALLASVPARVVASSHDTSVMMLERTYSAFISDHSDAVVRRGLLDTAQPVAGNVVSLPGGRRS